MKLWFLWRWWVLFVCPREQRWIEESLSTPTLQCTHLPPPPHCLLNLTVMYPTTMASSMPPAPRSSQICYFSYTHNSYFLTSSFAHFYMQNPSRWLLLPTQGSPFPLTSSRIKDQVLTHNSMKSTTVGQRTKEFHETLSPWACPWKDCGNSMNILSLENAEYLILFL